jgi:hypothetical protein
MSEGSKFMAGDKKKVLFPKKSAAGLLKSSSVHPAAFPLPSLMKKDF